MQPEIMDDMHNALQKTKNQNKEISKITKAIKKFSMGTK